MALQNTGSRVTRHSSIIIGLLGGVLLSSCGDMGDFNRVKEDFHYSYPLQPGGSLDLSNRNGSVDIAGWDRDTVDISGTKSASNADRLKQIKIDVSVTGNHVSITTQAPKASWFGSYGAKYVIRMPRQTTLARAQSTNGSVSIEDLEGGGHVTSTNGRISLARDTGEYQAETSNGAIEFEQCSGSERAKTTNGSIRGRLKAGGIDAESTNGRIDFTLLQPPENRPIRASTTNGGVVLAIGELHNNSVQARTVNGAVTLRLPAGVNANVDLESSLGGINNDLAVSATTQSSKHRLTGQLGNGGPLISASTTTGSIHLERY